MKKQLLTGYLKYRIQETSDANKFTIQKWTKRGNELYFNELFSLKDVVKFKRLNPEQISGEYILYSLEFRNSMLKRRVMLFETSVDLYPYGVVHIADSADCIFFRESEGNIFEIFISNGNKNQTAQLLTLLLDGSLKGDIDELLKQEPNSAATRYEQIFKARKLYRPIEQLK